MSREQICERLVLTGVVPVVRAANAEQAWLACRALHAGGVDVLEVTMPVPDAPTTAPEGVAGQLHGNAPQEPQLAEHMVFRPAVGRGFSVERLGEGAFAVRGRGIERLLQRFDVENEDAMASLEGRLRRIGVLSALEAEGFEPGDEIEIAGVTFELDPHESA